MHQTTPIFDTGSWFVSQAMSYVGILPISGFGFFCFVTCLLSLCALFAFPVSLFFTVAGHFIDAAISCFIAVVGVAVLLFMAHTCNVHVSKVAHDTLGVEFLSREHNFRDVFKNHEWSSKAINGTRLENNLSACMLKQQWNDTCPINKFVSVKSISYAINKNKEATNVFIEIKTDGGEKAILEMPGLDALRFLSTIAASKPSSDTPDLSKAQEMDENRKSFENSIHIN